MNKIHWSRLFGIAFTVWTVIAAIVLGGPIGIFINIPSFVVVVGVATGLQVATVGVRDFVRMVYSFRMIAIELPPSALRNNLAAEMRGFARYLYVAGAIGAIIGLVQILANINDWSMFPIALAVDLLALLYATLLSECLVRPCANRVEYLMEREDTGVPVP